MKILTYIPSLAADRPGVYVHPDSCWLLSNRPLFIPDFADSFIAIPAMAVKSAKLGKAVGRRFTPRYFGEYAPALIILPRHEERNLRAGKPIDALSLCFDNAVVLGDWTRIADLPDPLPSAADTPALAMGLIPHKIEVTISDSSDNVSEEADSSKIIEAEIRTELFPDAFSMISATNMIKTGDVVMIPSEISIPLNPGLNVSIRFHDSATPEPSLFTRFK